MWELADFLGCFCSKPSFGAQPKLGPGKPTLSQRSEDRGRIVGLSLLAQPNH